MDNQINKSPEAPLSSGKKKITLPVIALLLDILPVFMIYLSSFSLLRGLTSVTIIATILSPVVGLILGVMALSQGKNVTGVFGRIIAIIAVALPLLFIGFIVVFFVGASTGLISLM